MNKRAKVTITTYFEIKEESLRDGSYGPDIAELAAAGNLNEAFDKALAVDASQDVLEILEFTTDKPSVKVEWASEEGKAHLEWVD